MEALIDMVLETVLRSAIWRTTGYLSLEGLLGVAIIAFLLLAYRSNRKRRRVLDSRKGRSAYKYRDHYPD